MRPPLELIEKYNVSGPRYTSYPTAVDFTTAGGSLERLEHLDRQLGRRRAESYPRPLSLYLHVPFCFSLCWYCGCTKVITKEHSRGDRYIGYLEREMDLLLEKLGDSRRVVQVHFGGGTPTFLEPDQLRRLGEAIRSRFELDPEAEYSVEIDPRRCDQGRIEALREIGCNRASLGVQDTDPEVQKAIHRIQPFSQTREVHAMLLEQGIDRINLDLIYGLPRQSLKSFRTTLQQVMDLDPDRLALYSYAHLPDRIPSQRLLDETLFPSPGEKIRMFAGAVETLTGKGMKWIGMDHFAREEDELSRALREGTLQRNFQGYSIHARTDLAGLGMSGISQLDRLYYQNEKELESYYRSLDEDRLPVARQLTVGPEDRLRRDVIMQIMCRHTLDFGELSSRWRVDFSTRFAEELDRLEGLEEDGLVLREAERLRITDRGRFFLRNIAMVFDTRLMEARVARQYSKTV